MARLGDYIKQIRGVSYKPEDLHPYLDENSITLLRANNIQEGKLVLDDVVFVDKARVREEQVLRKGDILVCTSSGSKDLVGKAALVTADTQITFGAFCKVVRPISGDPYYFGLFFDSPIYRKKISDASAGANINNIRSEHIDELEISMPGEREQADAVSVLSVINSLISLRKKQLQKLDDLVKSRFVEMFGDPLLGEIKWPIHTVGDVADAIDPQPSHRTPPIDETGIPYVSIKDCDYKTGTIDFEHARKVSRSVLEEHLQRYKLNEGDFIIGKIGTIGNPIFVPARKDYTLSANIVLIQPYKQKASPYFLIHSFMTSYVDKQFEGAKNSTSQAAFGIQKVRMIKIPNPPIELQYQFETFVKKVDKSKLTVQHGLDKLELLKQSLMQKYFG